jgi:hypothetical protein
LSPLCNTSKKSFEVLRLGLGELGSTDTRISITPLLATRINLCIKASLFDCREMWFGRSDNDDTRHPKLPIRHSFRCGGQNSAKFADAGILKNGIEALPRNLDCAERVSQAKQSSPLQEFSLDQPVIGYYPTGSIRQNKKSPNQG